MKNKFIKSLKKNVHLKNANRNIIESYKRNYDKRINYSLNIRLS